MVPRGDQPEAVQRLIEGIKAGAKYQTLLGVTGSGKTFTMANVIAEVQKPTLVLAPNKTLAAQLCSEFREFFPNNAVEYFVSYYDYYQPEAYMPSTDTYIEKDSDINEEIDKLRMSATRSVFSRRDVIVVASVSCIYGIGSPEDYGRMTVSLKVGEEYVLYRLLRRLAGIQYERNDVAPSRGKFRVRGDVVEVFPSYDDFAFRLEFFGDELEKIVQIDPLTGEILESLESIDIHPARHYVTPADRLERAIKGILAELDEVLADMEKKGLVLEAARLEQRTRFDIEMLREVGHCSGIENYTRHITGRAPGEPPWVLIDYLPDDSLIIVDESHLALSQIGGMLGGDRSRKKSLVDYGFRLPSAYDNRPLSFDEFLAHVNQAIFSSATPTKRMAEDLADYLAEMGIKVHYLHSEVDTLERIEILSDLRRGVYDVVVGINLLREGLDLPEVSLVAILDADKEGFLRSKVSLIQTVGRAARHINGHVIMYADRVTDSMKNAIDETYRRRSIQVAYNRDHGITAESVQKAHRDIREMLVETATAAAEDKPGYEPGFARLSEPTPREMSLRVKELDKKMRLAADALEFERAAEHRDEISSLRQRLAAVRQPTT